MTMTVIGDPILYADDEGSPTNWRLNHRLSKRRWGQTVRD
jgi:hypothetical protein